MSKVREGESQSIDAILSRIRAELGEAEAAGPDPLAVKERARPRAISVPMLPHPDEAEAIQTGRTEYDLAEFTALDEETFLQNAYRAVLGREMDASGRATHLPALREGRTNMVAVLGSLRRSEEGQKRSVNVRGLKWADTLERVKRVRKVGRWAAPFVEFANLLRTTRRLNRRIAATDLRHRELISSINDTLSHVRRSFAQIQAEAAETHALAQDAYDLAQSGVEKAEKGIATAESAVTETQAGRLLIAEQARHLNALIREARAALPAGTGAREAVETLEAHALDDLYLAFENRFRGSTGEISKRVERYLPLLRQVDPIAAGEAVLDIGCGRGEWLALLREHNIEARGVDLNVTMVERTRSLGLDVVEGDAIAYLRALPADSLAAVSGFHIVEHLAFADLVTLLDEAHRALMPGGIVLFETPNPENIVVGACTFNYDPTHQKPLPPDFMRFLAEARGYDAARIIRSDADCQLDRPETGFKPEGINDWFSQPPDYALYAQKPHSAERT